MLTDYAHESWALGDYVRVEDKDLGISVTTRVVRREYNLQEPWNTVLELSTTLKNLGSSTSAWDNAADELSGVSGTASFKAKGAADTTKSMSQTVYPANCSTYTISAQIGSEDLEKLSDDSQVGIEVIIEYEDGTTESRFIDLY